MKSNWLPLAAAAGVICLAGPVLALPKSAATTGSKFVAEITFSKHGFGGVDNFWVKGTKIREEKKTGGGLRVIMITNEHGVFLKNKYSNIWARMSSHPATNLAEMLLGGPSGDPKPFLKEHKAKKQGVQKWNGQPCAVWDYASPKNIEHYKLWVSLKTGKPVHLVRDALLGGHFREKITVNYTSYAWNLPLPDALFKLPASEQVRDIDRSMLYRPTAQKQK